MIKNKLQLVVSLLILLFCLQSSIAISEETPLPRFASIKSKQVNARTGPNLRYPIKWVFVRQGEPVQVVAEFEQWRKIRDFNQDESWIHMSMLSKKQYGIVIGPELVAMHKDDKARKLIAKLEPETRVEILDCQKHVCKVIAEEYKGFVNKKNIWGINEE